jgi:4-hydroxybenzoate polyprenyltransferase
MRDYDPFGGYGGPGSSDPRDREDGAWFGRKRYGYGYGPRTWQGWLVMLALLVIAFVVASASHGHGAIGIVGLVPLVAVPLIIMRFQRR